MKRVIKTRLVDEQRCRPIVNRTGVGIRSYYENWIGINNIKNIQGRIFIKCYSGDAVNTVWT